MLRIEIGLVTLALVVAFLRPSWGSCLFDNLECIFARLAQRRTLAVVVVGLAALALRAALLPILPVPQPIVHDEFGYLLAADTFTHGRIANPTHPMWIHFETFHVMFHPTYASIYPPAQGLLLAAGKILAGNPFAAVWLSIGLMCASITWMLQGWMPPEWALFGGVIAILRYGVFGYWANSYWGGAVAAIAGALVLGALPRMQNLKRRRDAIAMGVGLAILANSRPYEGLIFSIPIFVILVMSLFGKQGSPLRVSLPRGVLPLAAVLVLSASSTGYYLWRVTGSPFRMPYQIERRNYAVAPYMIWQHVRPEPVYHHAEMRKMFVEEEMVGLTVFRSPIGLLLRLYLAWSFYLGPVLTLPMLMLAVTLPRDFSCHDVSRPTVNLLVIFAISFLGSVLVNFYSPHYSAPDTGLLIAMVLISTEQLRKWAKPGLWLTRSIALICILSFALRAAAGPLRIPLHEYSAFAWHEKAATSFGRYEIQRQLSHRSGKHLVIVHYKPDHEPFAEWVYNDADIDHSNVVWAREMDPVQNQQLLDYYCDRHAWLLEADEKPPRLLPYADKMTAVSVNGTSNSASQ